MEQTSTVSKTNQPLPLYWPAGRIVFLITAAIMAIMTLLFSYQVLQPIGKGINLSAIPEWIFTFLLFGSWTVSAFYLRAGLRHSEQKFKRISAAYLTTSLLCLTSWTLFAALSNFSNLNLGLYGTGLMRLVFGALSVLILLVHIATTFILGLKLRAHCHAKSVRACGWTVSVMALLFLVSLTLISYSAYNGSYDLMGYTVVTMFFSTAAITIAPLFFFKYAPKGEPVPSFTKRWSLATIITAAAVLIVSLTLSLTTDKTDMEMDDMEDFMNDDFEEAEYIEDPDSEYITGEEEPATVSDNGATDLEDEDTDESL